MLNRLVKVAVPVPLFRHFDYRWEFATPVLPGARVTVPFGRRQLIGIVLGEVETSDVPKSKLRAVSLQNDTQALLTDDVLDLLQWSSRYYHHPIGEVIASALPALLRNGKAAAITERDYFSWCGPEDLPHALDKAPLQKQIALFLLSLKGKPAGSDALSALSARWRQATQALLKKGWVATETSLDIPVNRSSGQAPELSREQQEAVQQITSHLGQFQPFLLNGVTGSGKTEVYIQCIRAASALGLQSLVLVPEISLTPQLMSRFEQRLDGCLVTLHSALNDTQRLQNWLFASKGHADVVIGTRSSVLVPMPRLGLLIVDEEHDNSLKQQDGFRYHARDLALKRALSSRCPVVLGSATPSFESLRNINRGKYLELKLTQRAGDAEPPTLGLMDIRRRKLVEGMSDRLLDVIAEHLRNDGQVLLFINRRGFSPTLLCNDCGAAAECTRCDAHMTVHARHRQLRCHHCGSERAMPSACVTCGSQNMDYVGYGTERIEQALKTHFPDVPIARIDRDSTRRKGALEHQLEQAVTGKARILVGTQMLAKGHHFPSLTLVGILDADRGLYGSDFRSLEHMAQLIVQVAGRAGRESRSGSVLIQTRNPDNPMLQTLVAEGYGPFAAIAMDDRRQAELPPFSYIALVRAEAVHINEPREFLQQVAAALEEYKCGPMLILGPAAAPMERIGGRYRAQLLLQSGKRSTLNESLTHLSRVIDELPGVRNCRWSIDVDPVDLF
ncbi:MAG: primosomal protein N' [Granulosicoccus sp.]